MTTAADDRAVIDAARSEAARILALTAGVDPAAPVHLSTADFRKLAELLAFTAARAGQCGDPDCFCAEPDGVRFWVPLPEVQRERAARASAGQGSGNPWWTSLIG